MRPDTRDDSYGRVAVALHWVIAALIFAQLWIGLDFPAKKPGELYSPKPLLPLHITLGMLVLVLSIARLAWRAFHRPPPHRPDMARLEVIGAHLGHWAFYFLIIAMPVTGWMTQSAHNNTRPMKGVLGDLWPKIPGVHSIAEPMLTQVHDWFVSAHELLTVQALVALLVLHVGAVIKHHLVDHDPVLQRMLPGRRRAAGPAG